MATTHIDQTIDEDTVSGGTVVLIVFLVILINMTVVWCYRRYNKREMNQEMHMQIESAVTQYYSLAQKGKNDRQPSI